VTANNRRRRVSSLGSGRSSRLCRRGLILCSLSSNWLRDGFSSWLSGSWFGSYRLGGSWFSSGSWCRLCVGVSTRLTVTQDKKYVPGAAAVSVGAGSAGASVFVGSATGSAGFFSFLRILRILSLIWSTTADLSQKWPLCKHLTVHGTYEAC
jgi:hypothetical protein